MRFWLTYILSLFCTVAAAQAPVLYFRNITTAAGLSNNKVNCIIQDKRGFIWIGTDDGLNRYDGNRFQVYRHNPSDSTSISGNIITDIAEDKDGLLWIATADGGLSKYDYRLQPDKQFRQYKIFNSENGSSTIHIINAIAEDKSGHLWLATGGHGLLRFDKNAQRFEEPVRRRSRTSLDVAMDSRGRLWVGREGGGILKIDPVTLKCEEDPAYQNVYADLPHMATTAIFEDSRQNVWLGSWDKVLYRVNHINGRETVFSNTRSPFSYGTDDALTFAEDDHNRIWIGGKYNGLYLFDPATEHFYHYTHDPAREGSLADNRVNSIFMDRSGIVWLGTSQGLSIHDPAQQQFVQTFLPASPGSENIIYDFATDQNGNLLIGSSNGLHVQSKNGTTFSNHPITFNGKKNSVTKLFRDAAGTFYAGTNESLFKLTMPGFELKKLPNTEKDVVMDSIIESRVVSVVADTIEDHPVLIASPYGHFMAYYDLSAQHWVSRQDSVRQIIKKLNIKDNLIRRFYKTRDGTIWLATVKAGLGEWKRGQPIRYYENVPGNPVTLSNNHIYDIAEDAKGNLWISTYGGGLHYFDRKTATFSHIPDSHNLGEGLATDTKGNVWMIANGNIHKYDPVNQSYSTYQLPDLEKTGGVKGYIFKGDDGRLYVAGTNYFIAFSPEKVKEINATSKVLFTDFRIFNSSYNQLLSDEEIVLNYNQNFFSVEYSAPGFQAGYPVQYAHRLEGVDMDWVDDGTQNSVNYTNLDGGHYTFKVRSTVKPGIWSDEIAVLKVRITPPVWERWWFFVLCAAFVALVVYFVYRYRINEFLKRQYIRNKIAQDLHDNVGSTLSSISVYSQVAKIYREQNKPEALQDTLEKISATSSEMISEMNDIVWAINPRNDNMETILQRMESFARPLLASKEIRFEFLYEPGVKQLHLEMTKRKNFYLIFKEAVNNALKYSECKTLRVNIHQQHHYLVLIVEDDGKGFDSRQPKASNVMSGNGLQNMRMRAEEMKGVLLLESEPGKGTSVTLRFPIP